MSFWTDQRVLVTGGTGFLGQHLVRALQRENPAVWALSSHACDLRDFEATRRYIQNVRPTLVFHLAAHVGGIGANQAAPADIFYNNAQMALNIVETCWQTTVPKLVSVGTVCAYPKHCPVPFSETDIWNGYPEETNAPYGIAKKILTVMSDAYRRQYGFNSIVLYPANLYGPEDNFDPQTSHVIPAMIRKFVEAQDEPHPLVKLWGDGSPTREFLYVEDCVEGLLLAAEHYNSSEPVNLGTGQEISMHALAEHISAFVGYQGGLIWDDARPNGQPRRSLDTSRAQAFGFTAKTSLMSGLKRTIEWYRAQR